MFLPYKRTGSSFVIMVIIMAVVVSMFAVSVSQLSRSRSSTLISDATEKQVLYLAEDAANQMMYQLNLNSNSTSINVTDASDVGPNFTYDASYSSGTTPFQKGVGTVRGTGYLMNPSYPNDTSKAIYEKTVYVEVKTGVGAPLMAYIKASGSSKNIPYYRLWNGTTWGNECSAPPVQQGIYSGVNAPDIQFVVLVFDPGSNHALLGMQDTYGNVWAEEWNGTSFSNPYLVYDSGGIGIRTLTSRDFDIAYENTPTNGVQRAVCVFDDENSYTYNPLYSIWDGSSSSWSAQAQVADVPFTMGQPYFIELAMNPTSGSKEIGMIYQDSGGNVFGEVWNGTSWSTMGQTSAWGTVDNASTRAVSLAYENNGTLVFGYGDGKRGYSRMWNGTTLSLSDEVQFTYNNNTIAWLTMKSIPGTNKVYAIYETSQPTRYKLYSVTFTGTTWNGTIDVHGTVYKDYTIPYFGFASTGPNNGTLFFSNSANRTQLIRRTWDGTTWSTAEVVNGWTQSYTVAAASSNFPNILSGYYENVADSNIKEWHTDNNGVWQTMTTVSSGNTLNPAYERIAIAIPITGCTAVKGTWREDY